MVFLKTLELQFKHENEDPGITAPRKSSVFIKFLSFVVTFMTSRRISFFYLLKSFKMVLKEENQGREPTIQVIACDNRVQASLW